MEELIRLEHVSFSYEDENEAGASDPIPALRDFSLRVNRGEYVAVSDFGTYLEKTSQEIEEDPTKITRYFKFASDIQADVDKVDADFSAYKTDVQGYIRQGIIGEDENGLPIIGIAIGQNLRSLGKQTVDGVSYDVLDNKQSCAFYTSTGISFRLGGKEVAYLTNEREFITDLVVGGTLTLGEWQISDSNGFTIKWIGG